MKCRRLLAWKVCTVVSVRGGAMRATPGGGEGARGEAARATTGEARAEARPAIECPRPSCGRASEDDKYRDEMYLCCDYGGGGAYARRGRMRVFDIETTRRRESR